MNDDEFIEIVLCCESMREASNKLDMPFTSFKRKAEKLGVYKTNQFKGHSNGGKKGFPLKDILEGKHPDYHTGNLKRRLIEENVLKYECDKCGNKGFWEGERLSLQLDHINGDSYDHRLDNLRILCPNCHSQTPTFGSKNNRLFVSDNEMIEAYNKVGKITPALRILKLSKSRTNYDRMRKLIKRL